MSSRRILIGYLILTLGRAGLPVLAQTNQRGPEVVPVRGTVEAVGPDKLVLRSPHGQNLTVQLAAAWQALAVSPSMLSAVKRGSFIATETAGRGNYVARRVLVILSPAMRDVGQGNYRWNFGPAYMMSNAIVDALVTQAYGNQVTIAWSGGEKQLVIPAGLPVVELAPGARNMIAPGAKVFLFATITGGRASAKYVLVGANGFTPPM